MSTTHHVAGEVVAANGGNPLAGIHRDRLRQLTHGRYQRTGANGALFGFRYPWMVKDGEMRYLTAHGRQRLGF